MLREKTCVKIAGTKIIHEEDTAEIKNRDTGLVLFIVLPISTVLLCPTILAKLIIFVNVIIVGQVETITIS